MPTRSHRGNPTPPMSLMSAAHSLHTWMVEHGRAPLAHECRPCNGLHHWQTYYDVFGVNNFSAGIIPMVSSLMAGLSAQGRMRQCLGYTTHGADCPETFPDEGSHVRFCTHCRKKNEKSGDVEYQIPVQVQRLTLRELTRGGGGWDIWQPWVEEVDWDGGKA
ncbi:MAG TPA: hypothetical protein VI542_07445 [Candidatus Tectomicrobia bacterium]